jgi:hypothetical protein
MFCVVALMATVFAAACGPSAAQVKTAKDAEYKAPASTVYELAKAVAAETYRIGDEDPSRYVFATAPQIYSREGGRQSTGADDFVTVTPGSIQLQLTVQIADAGLGRVNVTITTHVLQMVSGSPKPRDAPDDPETPPWVAGRVDALAVAIYERAKHLIEKP